MRKLGKLEVSEVGLGCNNFGGRIDAEATAAVVNSAIDAGINFFDTADVYGKTLSEEFMGRALAGKRDQVILATKFGHKVDEQRHGAQPAYVKQACEDSLRRLSTDRIDLYQLHVPDPETPIADTLGALDELVKEGKVLEIGCSNFDVNLLREARAAVGPGNAEFVSVQNHFSLFYREPMEGLIDECVSTQTALLPYFPLSSGLLSGKYRAGRPAPASFRIAADSERLSSENLAYVERLIAYAEGKGHTLLELAFGWLLAFAPVASVIAGATSPEQVHANAAAGSWVLTEVERDEVSAIPGPSL